MALNDYDFGAEPGSCLPWELDFTECEPSWADYSDQLKLRAQSLAWQTVRVLTAGRVGSCPAVIRPCLTTDPCQACFGPTWWQPYTDAQGNWVNATNRSRGLCSCCKMCEIILPGQVAAVTEVLVDGYTIDIQLFRIDNGNRLVRQDGQCWPSCQNLGAPKGAIGTLAVTYIPGVRPTEAGLWAVATLAAEFAKACTGAKCRLPTAVTSVARQGVTMEFPQGMFENGTGIREVDAWILAVNPNGLKSAPRVWSPDLAPTKHRVQTYQPIYSGPAPT